jgi:hypothetical protein
MEKLKSLKFTRSVKIALLLILVILALLPSYYFYSQYKYTQDLLQNPTVSANAETQALIDKVGKLIELPSKETPTVATVSDVTKLAGQTFFANAKNGDKVLIFSQAKEAILFRESIDKIIQVAPVNLGDNLAPSVVAPVSVSPTAIPPTQAQL